MKEKIELAVPRVLFAHKFSADEYHAVLPAYENRVEIACVTSGGFTLARGNTIIEAREGDVICNDYRLPLKIDACEPHSHHTFCVESELIEEYVGKIPLRTRSREVFGVCLRLTDEIIRIHTLDPGDVLRTSGLALRLVGELLPGTGGDVSSGDMFYVQKAKNYIYEHMDEPVVQRTVAGQLGISPEYLCDVFKRAEGRSLIKYANTIKLEHIRDLMETKGLTLEKASALCGYGDPNYVSRLYRKYFNEKITDFKRKP